MGMYDYVEIIQKCPQCKTRYQGQTKDGKKILKTYKIKEHISNKLRYIDVVLSCQCTEWRPTGDKCQKCGSIVKEKTNKTRYAKIKIDEQGKLTNQLEFV